MKLNKVISMAQIIAMRLLIGLYLTACVFLAATVLITVCCAMGGGFGTFTAYLVRAMGIMAVAYFFGLMWENTYD